MSPSRGYSTQLTAQVVDPDGDGLSYRWTANCPGTFGNSAAKDTSFHVNSFAPRLCMLSLVVTDSSGSQNQGWIGFWVADPPPIGTPDESLEHISCGATTIEMARPVDPCAAGFYIKFRATSAVAVPYGWVDGTLCQSKDTCDWTRVWQDWFEWYDGTFGEDWTTISLPGLTAACAANPQAAWVNSYLALDIAGCGFFDSIYGSPARL